MTSAPAAPPPCRVRRETVVRAVDSLLNWVCARAKHHPGAERDPLLLLVLTLNKIAHRGRTTSHVLPLPHTLPLDDRRDKKLPAPLDPGSGGASTLLRLRAGTCCGVKVARASQGQDEIVDNFMAAIDGAVRLVPRKWANVRSLHIKSADSLALPIYNPTPQTGPKIMVPPTSKEERKIEEKDYLEPLHEVGYGEDEILGEDDLVDAGNAADGEEVGGLEELQRMLMKKINKDVDVKMLKKSRVFDDGSKRKSRTEKMEVKKMKRRRVLSESH